MIIMRYNFKLLSLLIVGVALFGSCKKHASNSTGWNYNDEKNGGFEYVYNDEQETGPGLVFIEGGTFSMGRVEQDVLYDWNNVPRRITVSSFYLDQYEIRNVDYREYLFWIRRVFYESFPEVYYRTLPDTLVWRSKLGYNEPYVESYLRHPAYQEYPVVGVSWTQATDFCKWRTDRVNEMIMVREGLLDWDPNQMDDQNFNTETYLAGQYMGATKELMVDYANPDAEGRNVRMEDGIFLPKYRLPTEAEWEFAALSYRENQFFPGDERVYHQKIYPWNGHYIRVDDHSGFAAEDIGQIRANIVRGRGDYMGTAGALNDKSDITSPVFAYWPNDYGLYAMAGNVNEWVMDVYRKMTLEDFDEFRGFRGNVYKTPVMDPTDPHILDAPDELGRMKWREVSDEEAFDRRNYNTSDNINYLDGDYESSIDYNLDDANKSVKNSNRMYEEGIEGSAYDTLKLKNIPPEKYGSIPNYRGKKDMQSMITNRIHVYKGGGWKDRAYWMSPGSRRGLDQDQSQDDLGFRCAMHRVGSQVQK